LRLSALLLVAASFSAAAGEAPLEQQFDKALSSTEMGGWLKTLAAEPNHVGSPHDKANAELVLQMFKEWGWDARIETFEVLYPTPLSETLEITGAAPFKATLTEAPVPGDDSSSRTAAQLPAYVAYQGDGDVTAPLVYVNYGNREDYDELERMGVSVKGKIAIARYGRGWRGLKPKLAQDHGAIGCIIYSDPHEDGYDQDDVYPKGPARPAQGFQRGSVADMPIFPGDPLTPGIAATKDAKRLTVAEAPTILKIPVLPISYGDARHFLETLDGRVVPRSWAGSLPITYHVGGNGAPVHLAVKSDWSLKTLYNVVATIKGSLYPDEWVMRGNHRDGWVFGATDPLSGQIALLGEAKAIGALLKTGWKPKRTLVYLSWDGEEPGLLGSTEWAEAHAAELQQKALLYINSDANARGFLGAGGSHSLQHFVNQIAADITDPETGVTVQKRAHARLQVEAARAGADEDTRAAARAAADDGKDLPIEALGSGSDYSAYLQHLGLPTLDMGYHGEGNSGGVYHSAYDDYEHHSRFVDPGFVYAAVLAKTIGRAVLRTSEAELPQVRYGDFAEHVAAYLGEVQALAKSRRERAEAQAKLLSDGAYRLADDPTKSSGPPTALKKVPHFNLAPLEDAVDRLRISAKAYDSAMAAKGAALSDKVKDQLVGLARAAEETLAPEVGLPGRPWYRNLIYAPGRFTGYGAKTLPGVREAIEDERWADVDRYAALTAQALNHYADKLDDGVRLLKGG
jgi:N-acetylated-alpha-linked acidic dipeptidase